MKSAIPVMSSSGDLLADRRYAWAEGLAEEGDFAAAADLLAEVTALVPGWAAGWFALAVVREKARNSEGAREALRHCAALDPDDVFAARLHLARLGGASGAPEMSAAYVRGLFDQYAAGFDHHLTGALHYRGPEILHAAIKAACGTVGRKPYFGRVLDLGCGTGLMARVLKGRADTIAGVDLSPRMVALADATGLYAELATGDVVDFLREQPGKADLIVAADVLVYLGDLAPLMAACTVTLAENGFFAFTVQRQDNPGYRLGADMRWHHSAGYITDIAASHGLKPVICDPVSTRHDEGSPVPGLVVVLSR
jgi:predicted TPR repeat methyltransferase